MKQRFSYILLLLGIVVHPLWAEDRTIVVQSSDCGHPTSYTIPDGAPLTLIATPSYGYEFVRWSDGDTSNPRLLTVATDATYTAEFAPIDGGTAPTIVTITTQSEECGTPHVQQMPAGLPLTLVATPNDGSRFVQWSDGNTDNPRVLTATTDATYIAQFEPLGSGETPGLIKFAITAGAQDCAAPLVRSFINGSMLTLHAVPNGDCGDFLRWSDGNTSNPRTVTVTGDATYTAIFEKVQYTITTAPDNAAHGDTEAVEKE